MNDSTENKKKILFNQCVKSDIVDKNTKFSITCERDVCYEFRVKFVSYSLSEPVAWEHFISFY